MQTGAVYASSPPHPLYQHPYHPVLPGPQDHELKKQYLALLPPQQIIDICLNFDLHVPPYVKSSIWPADINAAIAAIQKASPPTTEAPAASASSSAAVSPAMDSLKGSLEPSPTADDSIQQPEEAQPPDKPTPTTDSSAPAQPSAQPVPGEQPTPTPAPAPAPSQQPPYPHQPYGYGHPQAAYPHAPYYQPPPGYPPYPTPYGYGTYHPHPGYPQQPGVPFTTAPLTHPPQQPPDPFNPTSHSTEDLPSYEEMIAEALLESNDPEGCAPKDMFTWMAARYPLQSNFRPSASQALQKAYKRGRFHKNSNGKYTINTAWEGGNTSRRTTRRPQTQNPTAGAPGSPFTHAPLVHHHQQPSAPQGYPGYGYPFQQGPQAYPGFAQQSQAAQAPSQPQAAQPASTTVSAAASSTDEAARLPQTEGNAAQDAWEAAQNILKAINFDSLLQLPAEEEKAGGDHDKDKAVAGPSTAPPPPSAPVATTATAAAATREAGTAAVASTTDYASGRAELQAHLALLAAQLAELSQEDNDDTVVHYPVVGSNPQPVVQPVANAPPAAAAGDAAPAMGSLGPQLGDAPPASQAPPPPPLVAAPEEEEDSEDDSDMEEVI